MSNQSSDQLFQLISSLSKPEKRYFKLYSTRHTVGKKNNYLMLFDAIEKQNQYNEEALKKKFKKEAFVNKFSIAKNRLYDAILRSLDAYHANSSIDAKLKRLLHCAEILYKKSLYKQSFKQLKSAKKLAQKYHKHTSLQEIYRWEKMLIEKDHYTKIGEDELVEMMKEDQLNLEKIKIHSEFWNIKSRLFYILGKQGKARTQDDLKKFKSIIDDTLKERNDNALFYKSEYLYYHIYSAYYFGIGDYEHCYEFLKKNVLHIEEYLEKFQEEPNVYFSVLTNIIYVGSQLKKYDEAFEYLNKLRELPQTMVIKANEDLDIKLFSSVYSIELTLYAQLGQFNKGLELLPIIEDGLKLYENKLNSVRKAYFYFQIAIIYFGAENYSEALRWVNRLLNDIDIEESQDIYCFGQLMNLIIHIELNNQQLIPYALRSTQRYLSTRNRVYKFETVILQFISKMMKLKDTDQLTSHFKTLSDELAPLAEDNFERSALEYFDFISWAESKARNLPFNEVVQEKVNVGI